MTKRRNIRGRQMRRWAFRTTAVDRRNGVGPDGEDPRHVSLVLPWCVEAHLIQGSGTPRISSRRYRQLEFRNLSTRRRNVP
jgi:hypothetical protein